MSNPEKPDESDLATKLGAYTYRGVCEREGCGKQTVLKNQSPSPGADMQREANLLIAHHHGYECGHVFEGTAVFSPEKAETPPREEQPNNTIRFSPPQFGHETSTGGSRRRANGK